MVVVRWRRGRPSTPIVASVARTRRWPAPLTAKAGATPTPAMTRPAAAGPTIRAPLNAAELSAVKGTCSPADLARAVLARFVRKLRSRAEPQLLEQRDQLF